MRELRRVIRPGAKRLNWNSLGINDFVAKCQGVSAALITLFLPETKVHVNFLSCSQAISKFESMVNQIQKNSNDINSRLQAIQTACLFKPPETKYLELPSAKVF